MKRSEPKWKLHILSTGMFYPISTMCCRMYRQERHVGLDLAWDLQVSVTDCELSGLDKMPIHYPHRGFVLDVECFTCIPGVRRQIHAGLAIHRERWFKTRKQANRAAALYRACLSAMSLDDLAALANGGVLA